VQVYPGVYQINGSPYGRHQNGYLIHREGATILIDSGDNHDGETLPEVARNAARWGHELTDASYIFLTHAHFDHASHAAELQRRGVKLVASPQTAEAMAAGDERCIGYAVQRTFTPCTVDTILQDGKVLTVGPFEVRCLAAPGHTEGMVVYEIMLDGERFWFTGDLLEAKHAHAWVDLPWTGAPDFDRSTYVASLARLLKEPPCDHVLPGHGPVALGNGRRLLEMAYTEALVNWR
jgi:metallo-beta-lactamase class B